MINPEMISPEALAEFIEKYTGLHYPPGKEDQLKKNLDVLSRRLGFGRYEDFISSIDLENPSSEIIAEIAKQLTIGETYFFREPQSFEALVKVVLPEIIARKKNEKRIRIWSAASCSGEEAYSIAITVLNVLGNAAPQWTIEILGTDVNNEFIALALRGEYSKWSFRTSDPLAYSAWLRRDGEKIIVSDEVKRLCRFTHLNLKTDEFPSIMNGTNFQDIIFCRNVFIYFNDELRSRIIQKFYQCLSENGALFLGLTELPYQTDKRFRQVSYEGAYYFVKDRSAAPASRIEAHQIQSLKNTHTIKTESISKIEDAPLPKATQETNFDEAARAYQEGEYQKVIAICSAIVENPKLAYDSDTYKSAARLLINALANSGQLSAAAALCETVISRDKLDHITYFVYSNISLELGDSIKAVTLLKKVIFLEPNYAAAHFVLCNIYKKSGNVTEYERSSNYLLRMLETRSNDETVEGLDGMLVSDIKFMLGQK